MSSGAAVRPITINRRREGLPAFRFFAATSADAAFLYDEVVRRRCYLRPRRGDGPASAPPGRRSRVVVDVGANVGLFASLAACEFGERCHVVAIEPNPVCVEALRMNIDGRNPGSAVSSLVRDRRRAPTAPGRVSVVEAACGAGDEAAATLTVYDHVSGWGSTRPDEEEVREKMGAYVDRLLRGGRGGEARAAGGALGAAGALLAGALPRGLVVWLFSALWLRRWLGSRREVRVRSMTLSQCLAVSGARAGDPIDLVKIDVERAELDVLRGIEDGDWARIGEVVLEVHEANVDGAVRLLEARGFGTRLETNDAGLGVLCARRRGGPAPDV